MIDEKVREKLVRVQGILLDGVINQNVLRDSDCRAMLSRVQQAQDIIDAALQAEPQKVPDFEGLFAAIRQVQQEQPAPAFAGGEPCPDGATFVRRKDDMDIVDDLDEDGFGNDVIARVAHKLDENEWDALRCELLGQDMPDEYKQTIWHALEKTSDEEQAVLKAHFEEEEAEAAADFLQKFAKTGC